MLYLLALLFLVMNGFVVLIILLSAAGISLGWLAGRMGLPVKRGIVISIVVCVSVVVVPLSLLRVYWRRRKRTLSERIESLKNRPTREVMEALLGRPSPVWRMEWKYVAGLLAKSGHRGLVYVLAGDDQEASEVPAPYPEPFEPLRLWSNDPRVGLLLEQINIKAKPRVVWREIIRGWASALPRWIRTGKAGRVAIAVFGAWMLFIYVKIVYDLIQDIISAIVTKQYSRHLLFYAVLFLLMPIIFFILRYVQWYVIPGGVYCRSASPFAWASRIRRYSADNAILIREGMFHCVADDEGGRWISMGHNEPDLVISAWLSDIKPPEIEELSDLQ